MRHKKWESYEHNAMTQPRVGLEPRPRDLETRALTMSWRPPREGVGLYLKYHQSNRLLAEKDLKVGRKNF